MNDDRAVLIGRVRKLMAIAEGNANEHEAAAAFDMAQRLLEQHGITKEEQQTIQAAALGVVEAHIDVPEPLDWHILLAYTTAKYNFCATIPTAVDIRVIGLYEAVSLALRWYAHVEDQIHDMPTVGLDASSYRLGIVNRVRSRLTAMRGREVHNRTNTLITSHKPLIDEYIKRKYPKLAPPSSDGGGQREMPALDWSSWQDGFDAGVNIKLEPKDDSWLGRSRTAV